MTESFPQKCPATQRNKIIDKYKNIEEQGLIAQCVSDISFVWVHLDRRKSLRFFKRISSLTCETLRFFRVSTAADEPTVPRFMLDNSFSVLQSFLESRVCHFHLDKDHLQRLSIRKTFLNHETSFAQFLSPPSLACDWPKHRE